jgi:uncharacterized protein YkwD
MWLILFLIPYDFIDVTTQGLVDAGRRYPGAQVCSSQEHPDLYRMARQHAKYQAKHRRQGHQNWVSRNRELSRRLPGYKFSEVCAESWFWETNLPMHMVGKSMYQSWAQSRGHWSVVSRRHDYFGAAMAVGSDGVWYACIIVGDK